MPHILLFIISFMLLLVLVDRKRIKALSKGGLAGAILAGTVDYVSYSVGLYKYNRIILPITGGIPFSHILTMFAVSIIYLDRLPEKWNKRFGYTVLFSSIIFAVEIIMHQYGAIDYLRWKIWYSFFLDIAGLTVVAYLNDKISAVHT